MAQDKKIRSRTVESLEKQVDPDPEIVNLRQQVEDEKNRVNEYKKEHGKLSSFFRDLAQAVRALDPLPQQYTPPREKKQVTSPCSIVTHLTDMHYGAVQVASEIEGFNEYSPDIADKRMDHFTTHVLDWVGVHRTAYKIDELVIPCTGDFISGDIHEELRVTNAFPTPVQSVQAGALLAKTIATFAPHFETVRVEFVVADNHGRLTKKPQAKEAGMNTHNYVVGYVAQLLLQSTPNIEFNLYPMVEKSIAVQGWRYLCLHGNNIRGWAGFPYYGIQRQVGREAEHRMNMAEDSKFHKILLGHFHAPLNHPRYIIGGSVSGTDAFDHGAGRHSKPCQTAWVMHPRHGEFDWTRFWLD